MNVTTAMVASEATGGLDNPGTTTVVDLLIDPNDAPDEMFEATIPIICPASIDFTIKLCKFPEDSTMVEYIDQQDWTELIHVTTIGLDEVKDFHTARGDGITFAAKPKLIHLHLFKCFLLYYKRRCRELYTMLLEEDVLYFTRTRFEEYCGSDEYNNDFAGKTASALMTGGTVVPGEMTIQEF
jgi:hypothetical protein